jgi:hypothetical protein
MILDLLTRAWHEILARPSGPMAFRFYLQPSIAVALALRDGLRDARLGRPAYFWSLFSDKANRRQRLRDGWRSVGRVFLFAFLLDTIYQLAVLRGLRPFEGVIVATFLALVPYIVFRGPANRIARRIGHFGTHPSSSARA